LKGTPFSLRPLWVVLVAVVLTVIALVLLEIIPGSPSALRPLTRYKHWRAETFFKEGFHAREKGDYAVAHLRLRSALALNPNLVPARIQLARLLVEGGRVAEGIAAAERVGMDGAGFGHDTLFHAGRFDELLIYCAALLAKDREREGVWLQSVLMGAHLASAATRERVRQSIQTSHVPTLLLLDAVLLAADRHTDESLKKLAEREQLSPLNSVETLLGLELLLQQNAPARAWVWLNRHRAALSAFDAKCAEYRVEAARDPRIARSLLESFPALSMNDARWARLAGAVVSANDAVAAVSFCRMLASSRPQAEPALVVSAWALLMLHGRESEAAAWEVRYRHSGAAGLPLLIGRELSTSDPKSRHRAVRLLAAETPLPRDMIAALLSR
jgi:tetratricopeptide (TPR) repeat protein